MQYRQILEELELRLNLECSVILGQKAWKKKRSLAGDRKHSQERAVYSRDWEASIFHYQRKMPVVYLWAALPMALEILHILLCWKWFLLEKMSFYNTLLITKEQLWQPGTKAFHLQKKEYERFILNGSQHIILNEN